MNAFVISSRTSKSGNHWLFLGIDGTVDPEGGPLVLYRCKASESLPKGTRLNNVEMLPTGMPAETLPKRIGDTRPTVVETVTCELSDESEVVEPYSVKTLDLSAASRRRATAPYARAVEEDDALPDA